MRVVRYIIGLGLLVAVAPVSAVQAQSPAPALKQIDDARAARAGIRKLTGRHLDLYTDVASDPEVDRLPAVFDQAVRQWAEYFGVSERRARNWRARAFLIADRERFDALDLMPPGDNDKFPHGISLGAECWLYDQPTPYYRRHLLLHEGTHAFMATLLGGCGSGWYMEGVAELMATHRFDEATGALTLRTMPAAREEVPMLGRIKLLEEAREAGRVLTLPAVMKIDNRRILGTDSYSWCWAAAKFLDSHPRYGERFRRLRRNVMNPNFDNLFLAAYRDDWSELQAEWSAFIAALDHGYDFERMAIDFERGRALGATESSRSAAIDADRGWQSTGVWLEAGNTYRVTAAGRFQIAEKGLGSAREVWPCEAGGVTIEYHEGQPLGMLLGAVVDTGRVGRESRELAVTRGALAEPVAHEQSTPAEGTGERVASGFARPLAIGLGRTFTPATSGTLYLRVNDSGGHLGDNRGSLMATIGIVE